MKTALFLVLTTVLSAPAFASNAWDTPVNTMQRPTASVAGGQAPIDQALSTIIPAAYRIALDQSVPSTAIIVWPAGDDWMKVLRAAVAPLDLYVEPDWTNNVIRIVRVNAAPTVPGNALAGTRMPDVPTTATTLPLPASPSSSSSAGSPHYLPWPQMDPNKIPVTRRGDGPIASAPTKAVAAQPATSTVKAAATTVPLAPAHPVEITLDDPDPSNSPEHTGFTLPAGILLSEGMERYAERFGWSTRWNTADDYRLDAPLPIPPGTLKEGVDFVLRTYQTQGGMVGDVPKLSPSNKVVVIRPAVIQEN
jgi:hypothetical protein